MDRPRRSRVEHTPSKCPRILRHYLFAGLHQYRFDHGLERDQFPRRRFGAQFLFHHHRLSDLEATLRRSSTSSKMVAWQVRTVDQHRCFMFPDSAMVLLLLAFGTASESAEYELEQHDVWWDADCVCAVLHYVRP